MARGTQFLQMLQQLRAELRRSSNPSIGVDDLDNLKQVINRVYRTLYMDYDWPHLRKVFPRITLNVDQQYFDFPVGLNPERVERAAVWYSGIPHIVDRGISFEEYAGYEPSETSEPALKWDIRFTGTREQIEIWPVPSTSEQELEFIGIQDAPKMVNDADTCLLDDDLIVLFASAELAAAQQSPDAQTKLQAAQAYYNKLKARAKPDGSRIRKGLGVDDNQIRSGRAIIRVR